MKLDLKKINPFTKTKDQKRDQAGKFTAGSGGLSKLQKLNWKRSLPVVLIVALVGGFLVFRSFAGTKPSAYQYSFRDCNVNSTADADVKCKNESADALVYRIYLGALGRVPDTEGHKWGVQKMAGDRWTSDQYAKTILSSSEARWKGLDNTAFIKRVYEKIVGRQATDAEVATWLPKVTDMKSRDNLIRFAAGLQKMPEATAQERMLVLDNKSFIEQIFKKMLKRPETYTANPTTDFWLKQLNEKKRTRAQVVRDIARSTEAVNKNTADLQSFVLSKPVVQVRQVAKEKQRYREAQARVYAVDTNNKWKIAVEGAKAAQKNLDNSKTIAAKAKLARADLTKIANEDRAAKAQYKKASEAYNAALKSYKNADKVLQEAKKVTRHSPDIPYAAIETWRNKAAVYTADAKNKALSAKQRISDIAAQYKVAESKYESQCNSGTDYNGSAPGCGTPPPPAPPQGGGGDGDTGGVGEGCGTSNCSPPPPPPGATTEEIDALWRHVCNSKPDYLSEYKSYRTGYLAKQWRDVYYGEGHRRHCNNKFKSWALESMKCDTGAGYNQTGSTCTRPPYWMKPTVTYTPNSPCQPTTRGIAWHGNYASCHEGRDKSKPGYRPVDSALICPGTHRKVFTSSGSGNSAWTGIACQRK